MSNYEAKNAQTQLFLSLSRITFWKLFVYFFDLCLGDVDCALFIAPVSGPLGVFLGFMKTDLVTFALILVNHNVVNTACKVSTVGWYLSR